LARQYATYFLEITDTFEMDYNFEFLLLDTIIGSNNVNFFQACAFRDSYEKFKKAGAEVVGISGDDPTSHKVRTIINYTSGVVFFNPHLSGEVFLSLNQMV
jgi:AhpC/TSA family